MNWSGTCIDIHEQKLTEQRLAQTAVDLSQRTEELTRSNQDLEHFTSAVSHDLQEPLRSISSFLTLLGRKCEGQLDEQAKEYIQYATTSAERMKSLLRDLLAYSRVARDTAPSFERIDLNLVLDSAAMNLGEAVRESGARLAADRLPVVRGDNSQLIELFQNLLSNAMKYRGEEPPEVEIHARQDERFWTISVRDNGVGFRQEHSDRIFGIFKRLHGRDVPGTGVGLAIVKRIVERHGGTIWAESEPGKGATFLFRLPLDEG
jgi:light-regulated signal transduction histidine kinase (bacteriophytochrome)